MNFSTFNTTFPFTYSFLQTTIMFNCNLHFFYTLIDSLKNCSLPLLFLYIILYRYNAVINVIKTMVSFLVFEMLFGNCNRNGRMSVYRSVIDYFQTFIIGDYQLSVVQRLIIYIRIIKRGGIVEFSFRQLSFSIKG